MENPATLAKVSFMLMLSIAAWGKTQLTPADRDFWDPTKMPKERRDCMKEVNYLKGIIMRKEYSSNKEYNRLNDKIRSEMKKCSEIL